MEIKLHGRLSSLYAFVIFHRLEGKVALITGGAGGIGEITARVFAHHGAKVVIANINDVLGHSIRDSLGQDTASYVHCDVTDESHIKAAVAEAVSAYGKLDIMFNNAGIVDPNKARIVDNDKADFKRVLAVNVTGVFLGIKHAAQAMIPARRGCIINNRQHKLRHGRNRHTRLHVRELACCAGADEGRSHGAGAVRDPGQLPVAILLRDAAGDEIRGDGPGGDGGDGEPERGNAEGGGLGERRSFFLASDEARFVSGHNLFIDGGVTVVN